MKSKNLIQWYIIQLKRPPDMRDKHNKIGYQPTMIEAEKFKKEVRKA